MDHPPSLISESGGGGASDAYMLSPQELGYSCTKLRGTMQVRIEQVRQYDASNNSSQVARGLQAVATPIFGGTTAGIDPEREHRRDLAMLQAYNQRLAEKKCKTFDLAAELKSGGAGAKKTP